MLPRLRFVVASLVIAVLPMVFLGAGMAPAPHTTSPAELARADKPVVLGPAEYSESQYRLDRVALSYARRENELGKLRALAAAPLANWIAAPAGAAPDNGNDSTVATVTTDGPAVVTVNTTRPEKASEVTVSVTVSPADKDKADKADKESKESAVSPQPSPGADKLAAAAAPEASKPAEPKPEAAKSEASKSEPGKPETTAAAPTRDAISDAPRTAAAPAPAGQVFAALTPARTETSALPQVHVVAPHAKPRPRVARRPKPVRAPPAPAPQKPPPFFELFVWLFNLKPDAHGQIPAGSASQLQQQQQQSRPFAAPTPGFQTASQH